MLTPYVRIAGQLYPATMSTDEAAVWFGSGPEALRQRHRLNEDLPVRPYRIGNRLRWPTFLIAQALGLPAEVVRLDDSGEVVEPQDVVAEAEPALVGAAASGPRPSDQP